MKLSVMERILLMNLLPKEGNFVTLKVIRRAQDELGFSEEDIKKYVFKYEGDKVEWREDVDQYSEKKLGSKVKSLICESLEKLDKEEKLTPQHINLYEEFVKDEDK